MKQPPKPNQLQLFALWLRIKSGQVNGALAEQLKKEFASQFAKFERHHG